MSKEIEKSLFSDLAYIIEQGKRQAVVQVNSRLALTYWHIGQKINEHVLQNERAEYGEKVVAKVSKQSEVKYGRSHTLRNVRRMMQFADVFPYIQIVPSVMTQLSWTHFLELLPLKSIEQRSFHAQKIAAERWPVRQTRYQIELLEMHKDGIVVAEYWTGLPAKRELEEKLRSLLIEARDRIENRKTVEE